MIREHLLNLFFPPVEVFEHVPLPLSDSVVSQLRDHHQRVGLLPPPCASSPRAKSPRAAIRSHWDTLRRLTQQRLHRGAAFGLQSPAAAAGKDPSWCGVRRGSYPPSEAMCPAAARPYTPPRYKPSCQMSRCRVCCSDLLWEQNRSAPSVYGSVLIDNIIEELDSEDEAGESSSAPSPVPTARRWTMSPPFRPYYSNTDDYLQSSLPPRLQRSQSPRIRTAPPSPMRPRRMVDLPPVRPVELAKQESLDELRTTVQLAACSMENSTKDIKLLGEKMAATTERMSETVQDNSQALALLTQVVDRLQTLLAATRTEISTLKPAVQDGTPKKSPKRPSLTHQSRCSFPSLPSTSSSSLSSSMDAPSTSHGTSCLSTSCHGSPRTTLRTKDTLKTKNTPSPQKKHLLTNGLLDEPKETHTVHAVKGGRSNQRKKRRKKT
ncbi:uncharacterized protein LOC119483651 [Sebastes umbrosus]|uniref:uncharacterized protein LOC119483651 n=1 Tax=Sebastes umbrosus TaxID=72105 RepID=UPI00189DBCA7|nr:uncharacterized protein LOC119483651 [Sebastes umbrosus]